MANVEPGEAKYEDADTITQTSANGAGAKGDALAHGANGLVLTSGGNGFAGIQASTPPTDGGAIRVTKRGIVPANVTAGVSAVTSGDRLVPAADGGLTNEDDGSGAAVPAGAGDIRAESDAVDGVAEVYVP